MRDLRPIYTRVVKEPIGESWLTWEDNRVANGPLAGRTLGELAQAIRPRSGRDRPRAIDDRFPLLVKFLFPGDKLSVQVHPDDEQARKIGQPCGKTECWYVLRAQPGAQVALGLKPGVTLEQFEQAIRDTRAEELLNWVDVHRGRHALRRCRHRAHHRRRHDPGGDAADLRHHLSPVRLRPSARAAHRGRLAATKLQTNAGKVVPRTSDGPDVLVRSPFFPGREDQAARSAARGGHTGFAADPGRDRRRRNRGIARHGADQLRHRRSGGDSCQRARVHCAPAVGARDHAHVAAHGSSRGAGDRAAGNRVSAP